MIGAILAPLPQLNSMLASLMPRSPRSSTALAATLVDQF